MKPIAEVILCMALMLTCMVCCSPDGKSPSILQGIAKRANTP